MAAVAAPPRMTSAAGVLALLEEPDSRLQTFALQQLAGVVDQHWSEISEHLDRINELSEEEGKSEHTELAALVASKCYFHLEEYDDALEYALLAGSLFDVEEKSEFVQTLISKCIDKYTSLRLEKDAEIDDRLAAVVDRMFQRCFGDGEYKQALGIALESRRLDMVEAAISTSDDVAGMLTYCFETALTLVTSRGFRHEVLSLLVTLYNAQARTDYFGLTRALQFLDNASAVADALAGLVSATDAQSHLTAYQVAFDIVENQNQQFQVRVCQHLPARPEAVKKDKPADEAADGADATDGATAAEGDAAAADAADADPATDDGDATMAAAADGDDDDAAADSAYWDRVDRVKSIVRGTVSVDLYVDFLCTHNHADIQILNNIKAVVPVRDSMLHHAVVMCHAIMQCGTTIDKFLLNNLKWLKKASNWSRFSATAAQGVVHKGHVREAMTVLEPYLPQEGAVTTKPYMEGGALYALGLVHANLANADVLTYLTNALTNTTHPVLQHGACLGIGLSAMGTADAGLWLKIKAVMMSEDANAGLSAGLSTGLLLAGAGPQWGSEFEDEDPVSDMLTYARETKHEKTSRGVALGLALMCYGREDEAAVLVEQMASDKDALIRYGGMYAIGMAYAGTSNNDAIRKLLHVAVSDVSHDVRRAAVTCLGFVMLNRPEQVPTLVSLLSESYNPHVRYGACTAVGIACAGTGMASAIELLEPMLEDHTDYVRQGALLGLSMVLQQEAAERCPAAKRLRAQFDKMIPNKRETQLGKMGAILGSGILDAGGRNCVIALRSRAGFNKMSAILGMALFQQHWYWYPCIHMMSLSLTPTALIGLNKDLKMPKNFSVVCNAKRKMFAYPAMLKLKKVEVKKKIATVELSTTAKAKAKQRQKDKAKKDAEGAGAGAGAGAGEDTDMTGDDASKTADKDGDADMTADGDAADAKDADESKDEVKDDEAKAAEESPFSISNPARVTYSQADLIVFNAEGQRYIPVVDVSKRVGVVMLRDTSPDSEEDVVEIKPPPAQLEAPEPDPPEPFEWIPN